MFWEEDDLDDDTDHRNPPGCVAPVLLLVLVWMLTFIVIVVAWEVAHVLVNLVGSLEP